MDDEKAMEQGDSPYRNMTRELLQARIEKAEHVVEGLKALKRLVDEGTLSEKDYRGIWSFLIERG